MSTNNDIENILRSQLEQIKDSPDERVWTNIERELKKRKRRRFLWLCIMGFLIVGTGTTLLIKTINSNLQNNTIKPDVEKTFPNKDVEKAAINEKNNLITSDSLQHQTTSTEVTSRALQYQPAKTKRTASYYGQSSKLKDSQRRLELTEDQLVNYLNPERLTFFKTKVLWDDYLNTTSEEAEKELSTLLTENEEIKDSKWSVTAEAIGSNYSAFQNDIQKSTTLNFGVLASYRLSNKAYLRTGCRRLFLEQITNTRTDELDYLEFPLEVKYRPFGMKINPYIVAGVSLLTLQKSTYANSLNNDYPAKTSLFTNLGLGVETKLIKHFYLNAEGRFNLFLKPPTSELEKHPYMVSFSMGLEYRF